MWELVVNVIDMYEKGELKGQKLSKRQLLRKPQFRQHLLQPLHHLPAEFKQEVLGAVNSKKMSLQDMKCSAEKFQSMELIKKKFVRITNSKSWEEACARFPGFVTPQKLKQFLSLNFRKEIPEVFKNYCDAALSYKTPVASAGSEDTRALLVCKEFSTITTQDIQSVWSKFCSADLIIASASSVSSITIHKCVTMCMLLL